MCDNRDGPSDTSSMCDNRDGPSDTSSSCAFEVRVWLRKDNPPDKLYVVNKHVAHSCSDGWVAIRGENQRKRMSLGAAGAFALLSTTGREKLPRKSMDLALKQIGPAGVEIPRRTAYYASELTLQGGFGSMLEQTQMIPAYLRALKRVDPQAVTEYECMPTCGAAGGGDGDLRMLTSAFVMPGPCRLFALAAMPHIALDACFMQGPWTLYFAVGKDWQHHTIPLAWMLGGGESLESWTTFCLNLRQGLAWTRRRFSIISDRDKGLIAAVHQVLNKGSNDLHDHTFCSKHLERNMGGSEEVRSLVQQAARALTQDDFDRAMARLQQLSKAVHDKLSDIQPCCWSSAYARLPRFGESTNNAAEQMASKTAAGQLDHVRGSYPLQALDGMYQLLMRRFETRLRAVEPDVKAGRLLPMATTGWTKAFADRTDEQLKRARRLLKRVSMAIACPGCLVFQVPSLSNSSRNHAVKLIVAANSLDFSCSCTVPWHFGTACTHVMAAVMFHTGRNDDASVKQAVFKGSPFTSSMQALLYMCGVHPVETAHLVMDRGLRVPPTRAKRGRPKKKRMASIGERVDTEDQLTKKSKR